MERIPTYFPVDYASMQLWFRKMQECGLLFHPDDDPSDIVRIDTGGRTFNDSEATILRGILAKMFELHGNGVYEAAWPVFAEAVGIHDVQKRGTRGFHEQH